MSLNKRVGRIPWSSKYPRNSAYMRNCLKERIFRRFAIMLTLFGTIIVFIVWIPVKFIKMVSPDFLPYRVFAISDEPLNHVSLELVTLQGNGPILFRSP